MAEFYNPYHFVPAVRQERDDDPKTADFRAGRLGNMDHSSYHDGCHSGRIICKVTAQSPLVVGDVHRQGGGNEPNTVEPFMLDGRPAIPGSSLRGMLSSLAEAASNSSLRVLDNTLLSYRKSTKLPAGARTAGNIAPLSAIGVVIVEGDGKKAEYSLRPLTLPTIESQQGRFRVPAKFRNIFPLPNLKVFIGDRSTSEPGLNITRDSFAFRTTGNPLTKFWMRLDPQIQWAPGHRDEIAGLNESNANLKPGPDRPRYLLAQKVAQQVLKPLTEPEMKSGKYDLPGRGNYRPGIIRALGIWNRDDIPRTKKHELFLPIPAGWNDWASVPIPASVVSRFHELADDRTAAENARDDLESALPYHPLNTARNAGPDSDDLRFRLKTGDLVFFDVNEQGTAVTEISLSAIWRQAVPDRVHDFFTQIDPELLPMNKDRKTISIAERIFGFVEEKVDDDKDQDVMALKGRVRISDARALGVRSADGKKLTDDDYLDGNVTLKIMGSPKPPCPAMYFKSRPQGNDWGSRNAHIYKWALNAGEHWPQGRKFYLHNGRAVAERGVPPWKSNNPGQRASLKARVTPVRKNTEFVFHIDFDNLDTRELGLLLYSLRPTEAFRHRIGMGKPLGLGRIMIDVAGVFLVDRKTRYTSAGIGTPRYSRVFRAKDKDGAVVPIPADRYEREVACADTDLQPETAFTGEWLRHMPEPCRTAIEFIGDPGALDQDCPVITPLSHGQENDPENETFQWFMANDDRDNTNKQYLRPITANARNNIKLRTN